MKEQTYVRIFGSTLTEKQTYRYDILEHINGKTNLLLRCTGAQQK